MPRCKHQTAVANDCGIDVCCADNCRWVTDNFERHLPHCLTWKQRLPQPSNPPIWLNCHSCGISWIIIVTARHSIRIGHSAGELGRTITRSTITQMNYANTKSLEPFNPFIFRSQNAYFGAFSGPSRVFVSQCNTSRSRPPVRLPTLTFQADSGSIKGTGVSVEEGTEQYIPW